MDRRKIERRDGSVTLVGSGPSGAVTLDAWTHEGEAHGILSIHRATWGSSCGELPSGCEYLPEGACFPDQSFTHGREAARLVIAYRDEEAWQVVEEWYRDKIEGEG
jgi:hypothetical protein